MKTDSRPFAATIDGEPDLRTQMSREDVRNALEQPVIGRGSCSLTSEEVEIRNVSSDEGDMSVLIDRSVIDGWLFKKLNKQSLRFLAVDRGQYGYFLRLIGDSPRLPASVRKIVAAA